MEGEIKDNGPTLDDFADMVRAILHKSEYQHPYPKQMLPENYIKCDFKPENQIKEGYAYVVDSGMGLMTGYGGALLMVKSFRESGYSDNDICNLIFVVYAGKNIPLAALNWKERKNG